MALAYGDVFTEVSWEVNLKDTGETIDTPILDEFGIQLYNADGTPSMTKEKELT